jgi:type II secretory pathway pseudopilin PulG
MTLKKQRGMSLLSGLVLLAVVGFFLTAAFKVGPLYLDNSFVSAAVASLQGEDVHNMTDRDIRKKLGAHFDMNNVRDIDKTLVTVVREKTRTVVKLDYEKRVNFMGNVDVVVMFKNSYDSDPMKK